MPFLRRETKTIDIALQIDTLSKGMMVVVTGVGMCVHIFSLGYMKDDDAKARYFCGLSFFMFSMTGIVLANNFAMMFFFWELVGIHLPRDRFNDFGRLYQCVG